MPTPRSYVNDSPVSEAAGSSVAWAPIFAGALVMLAVSLILTPLGAGLGLAWMSVWHHMTPSARSFTVTGVVWLLIVQWISAGLGGYLTGRMRTKWVGAHTHEVFFRDTVHGFLSWALAAVTGAVLLLAAAAVQSGNGAGMPEGTGISATASLIYSLSLFMGAFIASVAGALGGAHRDVHYETGRLWE